MAKIVVELDSVEAHLVLGAIVDTQLLEKRHEANLRGLAAEAAGIRASVLGRVSNRIVDQLMPEDPERVILREQVELRMI